MNYSIKSLEKLVITIYSADQLSLLHNYDNMSNYGLAHNLLI